MKTLQELFASRGVRRAAVLMGLLAVVAIAIASLDLQPNFSRVHVAVLSGDAGGNYHAIVSQLALAAARERGQIENIATQGSVENIQRLAAERHTCRVQFALVQDGLDWPAGLELIARLPRDESVFLLGREADRVTSLKDLQRRRIGIGPQGSGTNLLARKIFGSSFLSELHLTLSDHPLDEQFSLVQSGALDFAVLVMDEDAAMVQSAVRDRGLSIVSIPQAEVIARRLPRVGAGRIAAGQYDPIRMLPPTERAVLRVETLVVGNGCAHRSATV